MNDFLNVIILFIEYMEINMQIPGRIENYVLIIDLINLGVMDLPYIKIKHFLSVIEKQYICKVKSIFCLNASTSFSIVQKTISIGLSDDTLSQI